MEKDFKIWLKKTEEEDNILAPIHIKLSKKVSYRKYEYAQVYIEFYNAMSVIAVPDKPISKIIDIALKNTD